jgi:hypothetical protein
MKNVKIGEQIKIIPKHLTEVTVARVEAFKTLKNGKELIVVTTENGNKFPITVNEIVNTEVKITGKVEQGKHESFDFFGDREERALAFYPTLITKNGSLEDLERAFDLIAKYMEEELDITFSKCPYDEELNGEIKYGDGFHIEYAYGDMKEAKKEVMAVWKEAKKIFC